MGERYVISVKARKDVMGRDCEEWRYAGIDDGSYGSGYPCWCFSDYSCKSFRSIEAAKEWFNKSKSFLLDSYYENVILILKLLVLEKLFTRRSERFKSHISYNFCSYREYSIIKKGMEDKISWKF